MLGGRLQGPGVERGLEFRERGEPGDGSWVEEGAENLLISVDSAVCVCLFSLLVEIMREEEFQGGARIWRKKMASQLSLCSKTKSQATE